MLASDRPDIDECLRNLECIGRRLVDALVSGDTANLQTLMTEQVHCLRNIPKEQLSHVHQEKLRDVQTKVQQQLTLVEQALRVSDFFLQQIHRDRSYSYLG